MKQGEISLSTSAIVTIIIAIITLALLVVFENVSFGSASNKFLSATDAAIPAPQATSETPLTIAQPGPLTAGEQFTLHASVYSRTEQNDVSLILTCSPGLLDGTLQGTTKDIAAGAQADYILIGRIASDALKGETVCTLDARPNGGRDAAIGEATLVATIR